MREILNNLCGQFVSAQLKKNNEKIQENKSNILDIVRNNVSLNYNSEIEEYRKFDNGLNYWVVYIINSDDVLFTTCTLNNGLFYDEMIQIIWVQKEL